jgi:ADP-ribosylglycohydrolase
MIGSRHEFQKTKSVDFELFTPACTFTDDTVLTVAVADALINGRDYGEVIREYGLRYPDAGYGGFFHKWLISGGNAYNSFGNGSAMRVSPVGWAFNTEEDILREAECSGHP